MKKYLMMNEDQRVKIKKKRHLANVKSSLDQHSHDSDISQSETETECEPIQNVECIYSKDVKKELSDLDIRLNIESVLQETKCERHSPPLGSTQLLASLSDDYIECAASLKSSLLMSMPCHLDGFNTEPITNSRQECQCDICFKFFTNLINLNKHKRIHFRTPLTCIKCNKVFNCNDELAEHLKIHRKEHKCSVCSKVYTTMNYLNKHKLIHTESPPTCSICSIVFSSRDSLRTHLKTHSEDRQRYSCPVCEKSFTAKKHCTYHMKVHTMEYKCPLCDMAFSYKIRLDTHLLQHSDKRDHECDICGKFYNSRHHLKKHKQTHRPRTFTCEHCDQLFRTHGNMVRHMIRHVPLSDRVCYPCFICQKPFSLERHLIKHLKTHSLSLSVEVRR